MDAQVVIVRVGTERRLHGPRRQGHTLAMASVWPVRRDETHRVKRYSYILSKPAILKLSIAPDLRSAPAEPVGFIRHHLDKTAPAT
jgi:hypothetical protein